MKKLFILFSFIFLSIAAEAGLVAPRPSPTTAESSVEARQAQTKQAISGQATAAFVSLRNAMEQSYFLTWKNPLKLTPNEVMAGLGKDGCSAHQMAVGSAQMLNFASPGSWTLAEPCPVTCKEDGTAIVSCPEVKPEGKPAP